MRGVAEWRLQGHMSIRGIDTQIMITRTPDISKDTSVVQQRPEINQQILAEQRKIFVAQDQKRVQVLEETEMDRIRTEEDGGGSGGYGGSGGRGYKEREETDENGRPGFYVPAGNNIFDIRI